MLSKLLIVLSRSRLLRLLAGFIACIAATYTLWIVVAIVQMKYAGPALPCAKEGWFEYRNSRYGISEFHCAFSSAMLVYELDSNRVVTIPPLPIESTLHKGMSMAERMDDSPEAVVIAYAGFPRPCVVSVGLLNASQGSYKTSSAITSCNVQTTGDGLVLPMAPAAPVWGGLFVNAGAYFCIILVFIFVVNNTSTVMKKCRQRRRVAAGLCSRCRYPLHGMWCPECGMRHESAR